jgi:hypothetical protein
LLISRLLLNYSKNFKPWFGKKEARFYICDTLRDTPQVIERKLAYGVTGNTSDFGSEESRFEPW